MAHLGTIGKLSTSFTGGASLPNGRIVLRGMRVIHGAAMGMGGRDETQGDSAPSHRMDAKGSRTIPWPVSAQEITITCQVKQAANQSPRPRLVLKANSALGIDVDVESVAASGTGWVTLSITFTPTAEGVVEIIQENRLDYQPGVAPCYWDNLQEE
jgi:hypothetical protein